MRKKCILLGLVETVNFVDEHNRPRAVLSCPLRVCHDCFDFLDPGQNRRELNELRFRHVGNDLGERGLSRAGRSPENQGADIISLDLRL